MQTVATDATIELPPKAKCPICGAKIYIDDISAWEKDDADGTWYASEVSIQCETEPDIDSDEWEDWHNGHWSTPYIDWLPLDQAVLRWLKKHYRFEIGEGRGSTAIAGATIPNAPRCLVAFAVCWRAVRSIPRWSNSRTDSAR